MATVLLAGVILAPAAANADEGDDFATPVFGLNRGPNRSLLVADAGAGIWQVRGDRMDLIVELPGVADVEMIRANDLWAVTGLPPEEGLPAGSQTVFRVQQGVPTAIADLGAFEAKFNPDGGEIDSNPFDIASLGRQAVLVADAGGNDLLLVQKGGKVGVVATFPQQVVSTANAKALAGCPDPVPDLAFACDLPDAMPADTVPTSVAIGPDGAYYVGELIGFPAPVGASKIWRIEPGTRNAGCGVSPACSVVVDGLTSIVDLSFGPDGRLYVVEMDEASWLAVELGVATGGTVDVCNVATGRCRVVADGLPLPSAVAVAANGTVYATILSLVPGEAQVIPLT
jgi:hypothetical protein